MKMMIWSLNFGLKLSQNFYNKGFIQSSTILFNLHRFAIILINSKIVPVPKRKNPMSIKKVNTAVNV